MWHVSVTSAGGLALGSSTLIRRSYAELAGLGDASAGEWLEERPDFVHLRRRLSTREERKVGPVVDVRGTPEAHRRLALVAHLLPAGWDELNGPDAGEGER